MTALEKNVRETPRMFRMELTTDYSRNTRLRDHFRDIPNKTMPFECGLDDDSDPRHPDDTLECEFTRPGNGVNPCV